MSDLKQTIYLRQSSGFGPWVECEKSHPDAVAFDRRTQPDTVDGDPIGDLQAESRQAKLDDFIASMKTQPEATAPAQDLAQEQAATMLIQRKKIQTLNAEIAELRKKLSGVNSAAHRLAARLCAIPPAKTIRGNDLITREVVMGFVVEWRRQWDEANEAALASSANALIAGNSEPMTLVKKDGQTYAAYPRRKQAEVYASGLSSDADVDIIDGVFTAAILQPQKAK